jgi:hypothetical protein
VLVKQTLALRLFEAFADGLVPGAKVMILKIFLPLLTQNKAFFAQNVIAAWLCKKIPRQNQPSDTLSATIQSLNSLCRLP